MRQHTPKVKANSMQRTASGIAFIVECEGFEESFHFQNVGLYEANELTAKVNQALERTSQHHEHDLAGAEHLENLLKQYANGVPSCTECG